MDIKYNYEIAVINSDEKQIQTVGQLSITISDDDAIEGVVVYPEMVGAVIEHFYTFEVEKKNFGFDIAELTVRISNIEFS